MPVEVIASVREMQLAADAARSRGLRIGLVPTMGFLHDGHLSLVRRAREESDLVVVSIFVNPKQFGPGEDYDRYPRSFDRDVGLVKQVGGDVVFAPSNGEMYPEGFDTSVEVGRLARGLCGASRPGHFRGVATVVTKLLCAAKPHLAFFGQKDAQQTIVIARLAADLNIDTRIVVCPTVREDDGLAMSSRNAYLSEKERQDAAVLYSSLSLAELMTGDGERDPAVISGAMQRLILSKPSARIDYVAIVDPRSLEPLVLLHDDCLILLAVWIGRTRLIDNVIINVRS